MGKVNTRNGLIEFYRFVFACLIIAFHGAWISGGNRFIVFGGGISQLSSSSYCRASSW